MNLLTSSHYSLALSFLVYPTVYPKFWHKDDQLGLNIYHHCGSCNEQPPLQSAAWSGPDRIVELESVIMFICNHLIRRIKVCFTIIEHFTDIPLFFTRHCLFVNVHFGAVFVLLFAHSQKQNVRQWVGTAQYCGCSHSLSWNAMVKWPPWSSTTS